MERFAAELKAALPAKVGEHRLWIFGHLGDGNLHVIVQVPPQQYMAARPQIEALVYGGLRDFNGSVSAEHGIGLEKKPWLAISRNPTELALMKQIKQLLDPKGLLNPGKIF
jgi:FAD/FMN-containing dehydrogenase